MNTYKKISLLLQICSMLICSLSLAQPPSYVPPGGLAGWWSFSGNANDASGYNAHGTVFGAQLVTDRFGNTNSAYLFDGVDDYILIGNPVPAHLQIQNQITLSAWIFATQYPTSAQEQLGLIVGSQCDACITAGATIFLDGRTNSDGQSNPPGHIHFQIGNTSWRVTNSQTQVPLNQWVHIAATRKTGEPGKIYYNGVLQPVASAYWNGVINYTGAFFAMGRQQDRNRFFNGIIDDVGIWNRALEECEIQQLYNGVNQYPEIQCPDNQIRNADTGFCSYTAVGNEFDATFIDDCPATVTIYNNLNGQYTLAGYEFSQGTTGIIWHLTDGNGLTASCYHTVTVIPPDNPGTLSGGTIVCGLPNSTELVLTGYTGTIAEWQYSLNNGNTWNSIPHTSDTLTATNISQTTLYRVKVESLFCGFLYSNHQQVAIDYVLPIITCVPDRFMFADTSVCGYTVIGLEFDAVFSDNCPGAYVINSYNGLNTLNGEIFPVGITNVQWYVYDSTGNVAACSFNVNVTDNQSPVITAPPDVSVFADSGMCSSSQIVLGDLIGQDNCGIMYVTNDAPSLFPVGTTIVTWSAGDVNGNASTVQQSVTVVDNQPPVPSESSLPDIIAQCSVYSLNPPMATDNCAGLIEGTHQISLPLTGKGTTVVTWTFNDGNGNQTVQNQNVMILHDLPVNINDNIPTKFSEKDADSFTIVLDHLNNATTGEMHGAAAYVESVNGLSFAGDFSDNQWIRYPYNTNLRDSATFDMWIYPTAYSTPLVNINWSNTATTYPSSGHVFHLDLNAAGRIGMGNWPGSGLGILESNAIIPLNQWTHLAVAWGDSTVIYINGKTDNSNPGSFRPSASGNYSIRVPKWGSPHDVYIDEFHVSRKRRKLNEITNGYLYMNVFAEFDTVCGNSSTNIIIANPQKGVSYQLYKDGNICGNPQAGNSDTLFFDSGILSSSSQFMIEATDTATLCSVILDTVLQINVMPAYEILQSEEICNDETFFWRGNAYGVSGIYYDSLMTQNGCDSNFVLVLTVLPQYELTDNIDICEGESFFWDGQDFNASGIYYNSLTSVNGCDSIMILNLTVNPIYEFHDFDTICFLDSLIWHGETYHLPGIYVKPYQTIEGCDSLYYLHLVYSEQPPDYVPLNGLRGWWSFNGNAKDLSCHNIHGTVNDATLTTNRQTQVDSAYLFDGIYDWIDLGDNPLLNPGIGDITISAWIQTTSSNGARIFSKGTHGGYQPGYDIMIYPNSGGRAALIYCPGTGGFSEVQLLSDLPVNDGNWHLITGVITRNGTMKLYVDGQLQTNQIDISNTASYDIGDSTFNATIGVSYNYYGNSNWLNEFFNGKIDEVGVWMRSLTQCEIKRLHVESFIDTTFNVSACGSYNAPDGQAYTVSGIYTAIIPDNLGCDSIIGFDLTIFNEYLFTENDTVSHGDSLFWHGYFYSQSGTYYANYQTIYGCDSVYELHLTVLPQLPKSLVIHAFIEGLYLGNGLIKKVVDVDPVTYTYYEVFGGDTADLVTLELWTTSGMNVYSEFAALTSTGVINAEIDPFLNGNYYIYIKHRNSIAVSSAAPVSFAAGIISYNFTTSASSAFFDNQKYLETGVFGLFAGDVDQDGSVGAIDLIVVDNASRNFVEGFNSSDINGDGETGAIDLIIVDNNSRNFVFEFLPF
jgi:hypothetical protein